MVEQTIIFTVLFVVICLAISFVLGWYLKNNWKFGLLVMLGCLAYFIISSTIITLGYLYISLAIDFFIWVFDIFAVIIYLITVLAYERKRNDLLIFIVFSVVMLFLFPLNATIFAIIALFSCVLAVVIHFSLKSRFV